MCFISLEIDFPLVYDVNAAVIKTENLIWLKYFFDKLKGNNVKYTSTKIRDKK
jgi:hypothetical protein